MRRLTGKRTVYWGVAAILIAAAFLVAAVPDGEAATEEPVIDTAAPVESTQCAPCHLDLGDVNRPGLVFSHGNHLLVSCDGCHSRMPHRAGSTDLVPMEVCFACHGVQHGDQGELATGECADCHTKSFTLRPTSHVETWAAKPHADAVAATEVNDCMMCHEAAKDCDACHEREGLDIGKMPEGYHTVVQPQPARPSVKIFPSGETSMSQCAFCHEDLDAITPGRLIFAHAAHTGRNYSCQACHTDFAHQELGIEKPDMQSCYRCHTVFHQGGGLIAEGDDCLKCHPKTFELMPSSHTSKFIKGDHADEQAADPTSCSMCHSSEFCVTCHSGEGTTPNAPSEPVIPASHKNAEWVGDHGGLYLEGQGACGACHDGPSCQRCHQTVLPHPVDWIKDHSPKDGVTAEDCNVCHTDRNSCQTCHHEDVKSGELIAKNCTPCHEEMKTEPPTDITNKGLAEHAVHFNVAESKGKPYRCYECHVDFGTSDAAQEAELQQGHDLRLCYDCHGALDPFNREIAPYRGAELCLKCHDDLSL